LKEDWTNQPCSRNRTPNTDFLVMQRLFMQLVGVLSRPISIILRVHVPAKVKPSFIREHQQVWINVTIEDLVPNPVAERNTACIISRPERMLNGELVRFEAEVLSCSECSCQGHVALRR